MKCAARVALGVAGGYFLGRTKKLKLAMMLGGAAAGRRAGGPGQLLAQGTKLLGQSPEFARLTDELRGRLLEAGKGAAVAVATRQVENLTERVVSRVGPLAETGGKATRDAEGTGGGTVGEVATSVGGRGRRRSDADVDNDEEPNDEGPDEQPADHSVGEPPADLDGPGGADLDEPVDDTQGEPAQDESTQDESTRDEPAQGDQEEEPRAPRRRAAVAGGGRAGRAARGRQGRSNG